jgi:hypothetical protein
MSEKKYVYEADHLSIDRRELVAETPAFVTVRHNYIDNGQCYERRYKKDGWRKFFPTWEEAHMHLVDVAARKYNAALAEMKRAAADKAKIEAMRNPEAV